MALTRPQIIDAAYGLLADHGLAGLTMRRLAQILGVQPGAAYYHVASKQDLLVAVAERILEQAEIVVQDPAQVALDLRAALLPIRDSADVISFANAFRPDRLVAFRSLEQSFGTQMGSQAAEWAAQTLIHYVLGFVSEEQNRAELIRAGIVIAGPTEATTREAFRFGVTTILRGLSV